jgi:Leu/Phe-tRNA-protein transferase
MSQIYYITKNDIDNHNTLFNFIYPNKELNYYYSDDFSVEFYIALAKAGFITVYLENDNGAFLLPEIQFEYAVLDFKNLHISKRVKKLLRRDDYRFIFDGFFDEIIEQIQNYHKDSWIKNRYVELLYRVKEYRGDDFRLVTVALFSGETLVAGEIGYITNSIYTSLSGFSNREFSNYGKLQMVLLAKELESMGIKFWNLGHATMQYKIDLGAKIYSREKFLKRFL